MKKSILFILVLFTSLWAYSQESFYAYIEKDVTTSSGKTYYSGSLLPLKAEVCVKECTTSATANANNKSGGVQKGAVFPITQFDSAPTTDLVAPSKVESKEIRFQSKTIVRYNVTGVTVEPVYRIGKDIIKDLECFLIVPDIMVDNTKNDSLIKELQSSFENYGSYIVIKEKDKFKSAKYALVYGNEQGPNSSFSDKIDLPEVNNAKLTSISFAFSNRDERLFIPDFSLMIGNFPVQAEPEGVKPVDPEEKDGWYRRNDSWVNPIAVFILCLVLFLFLHHREKKAKTIGGDENGHQQGGEGGGANSADGKGKGGKTDSFGGKAKRNSNGERRVDKQRNNVENPVGGGDSSRVISEIEGLFKTQTTELVSKIKDNNDAINTIGQSVSNIKTQVSNIKIDQIQKKLETIDIIVTSIKSLVSNTDDKEMISDLTAKISAKEISEAELTRKLNDANTTITGQNSVIEDLKKQLVIPNSEKVKGAERFVSFAQRLLASISNAENKMIQAWASVSDVTTKERAGYFIVNEFSARPTKEVERWISILSTLKMKSVINDPELVKYIKTVDEGERVTFVTKQFVGSVVVPFVSCVLVLLEQFRTGKEWGYLDAATDAYATCINEIIALCKSEDISVDYCKLYEKLNDYENVEIESVVPTPVSDWIDTSRKDVVLYVKKYSVSSKLLNHVEKTSCVVLI